MAAVSSAEARLTERLYEEHHRRVFAFCLQQLRNRDDASEAVQTTYLHALRAARRGVVPSLEVPWLIAIARNVCRTRWDAGARRRRLETVHDPHALADLAPAAEPTDMLAGIAEALAALPDAQRRAVLLRDWQGFSYQEVADELGVTVAAAETLIFRGRKKLACALEGDRRFGFGSVLSWLKPGFLSGSGVAAKVALGTALAVGITVAAGDALVVRTPPRQHVAPPRATSSPAAAVPNARAARPTPARTAHVGITAARRHVRTPALASPFATRAAAASTTQATAPTAAVAAPTTSVITPTTPPPTAAASAAPAVSAPPAPVPTTPTPAAQTLTPAAATVTNATQPVVTAVTQTADPVVATVTTAVQPVVTTVTTVVPPTVTAVPTVTTPPVHIP